MGEVKAEDATNFHVSQAYAGKKIFIGCKASHAQNHMLKLSYDAHKMEVSTFLVTREVRGTVTNGLCQGFPGRNKFFKCGTWGTSVITYDNAIDFPVLQGSESNFTTHEHGPNSCHAKGWIKKIGEYKGADIFCPHV